MEYTRSKGDDYETFEGTPEEIAQLIKAIDKEASKPLMKTGMALAPVFPPLFDMDEFSKGLLKKMKVRGDAIMSD